MADKGWAKIDRNLTDHWIWKDKPFSKGQAWIDLIILADFKDHKGLYKGKIVDYKRGTVHISITALANRWGWGREKTRNFLRILESDKMITLNATTNRTTITLVNYGKFQDSPTTNRATNRQRTSQRTDSASTTPKECKEEIKERKEIYMPPADDDDDEGMSPEELMDKIRRGVLYDE